MLAQAVARQKLTSSWNGSAAANRRVTQAGHQKTGCWTMADSATYSVGQTHATGNISPRAPQLPPRASATAIATAFIGCATQSVLQNSPAPAACSAARASASISACVTATSTEAAPSCSSSRAAWARVSPVLAMSSSSATALPCPALHGHGWQVDGDAAVAVALLGAHGVLQAVARGCLGHPLGRFAVGAHQQRAGALLHDPVGQQRRAICIKILTPLTGAAGAATGPAGYRSPYKEGHRGPAAHRECARHCLAAAFPRAAPCRPPPPGGAGCQT